MKILRNKVYSFTLKLVKDPSCAEDITQDIMLKAWEHKDKILGMDNPDFYVFKMAKNAVMDYFKKLAKEKSLQEAVWVRMEKSENKALLDVFPAIRMDLEDIVSGDTMKSLRKFLRHVYKRPCGFVWKNLKTKQKTTCMNVKQITGLTLS